MKKFRSKIWIIGMNFIALHFAESIFAVIPRWPIFIKYLFSISFRLFFLSLQLPLRRWNVSCLFFTVADFDKTWCITLWYIVSRLRLLNGLLPFKLYAVIVIIIVPRQMSATVSICLCAWVRVCVFFTAIWLRLDCYIIIINIKIKCNKTKQKNMSSVRNSHNIIWRG